MRTYTLAVIVAVFTVVVPSRARTARAVEAPAVCDAGAVVFTSQPGAVLDAGWTGIFHGHELPHDAAFTLPLDCDPATSSCTVAGDAITDAVVGPPIPLSSAGVPICVLTTLRETPRGSYDCGTGCSELRLPLLARMFLFPEVGAPCPTCVGDPTPNDGVKGGTCNGGTTPGGPCDVGGISDRFAAGATSNDCLPTGSSVGELNLDLNPVTTGTTSASASIECRAVADFPDKKCYCPNQVAQNSCFDGNCGATGVCETGPVDGVCSLEHFRFCRPDSGTEDCDDILPGSGTCVSQPRACFGSTIERSGTCGTDDATLATIFCAPPTRAAAINQVMGLPGPVAITLPVHVAAGTPPPPPGACSAIPRSACHTIASNKTAVFELDTTGHANELTWRWLGGAATSTEELGDPRAGTDYALCAYAPSLVLAAAVDGGAVCNGKPCWKSSGDGGFVYKDSKATHDGLTSIDLSPGATDKAKITLKGAGAALPIPALPLATPPRVQLQASNGECWESVFGEEDVRRNDVGRFRAVHP